MPVARDSRALHSVPPSAPATSASERRSHVWPQRGRSRGRGRGGCAFPRRILQRRLGTGIRPHSFWGLRRNDPLNGIGGTTRPGETQAGTAGMQPSPRDNLVGAHSSRYGQRGRKQLDLALSPPSPFSPHRTNRPPHALKILFCPSRAPWNSLVGAAPPCAFAARFRRISRGVALSDYEIKLGRFSQ